MQLENSPKRQVNNYQDSASLDHGASKPGRYSTKSPGMATRKLGDGMLRSSSAEDQEMSAEKIEAILVNNKYFPHLYDPYYDRSDVKSHMLEML